MMNDSLKDQIVRAVFRMRKINLILHDQDMDLATFTLMRALDKNRPNSDENIYLSELNGWLNMTKAALSQMANHLEEKGYLTRETNRNNRRKVIVTLTPEGKAALEKATVVFDSFFSELLSRLGDKDAEDLVRLFNRFTDIAREIGEDRAAGRPERDEA